MDKKTKKLKEFFDDLYDLKEIEYELVGDNEWRIIKYQEKGYEGHQPFVKEVIYEKYIVYKYDEEEGVCEYIHIDHDEDFHEWRFSE